MGTTFSSLEAEKQRWTNHDLAYDSTTREANLPHLTAFPDGEKILLCFQEKTFSGLNYQHWFVTNEPRTHFLGFDSPDRNLYDTRVHIKFIAPNTFIPKDSKIMDEKIRKRMRHVIGMSNYSLCLRNCEHVANYVFRGRWISAQMDNDGALMKYFRSYLAKDAQRLVNSFPSSIRPQIFEEGLIKDPMYSFVENHYKATQMEYYLDYEENTFNVLVLGATGTGKSHLINVFFNQHICDAKVSHRSVTNEVCFIRGRADIYDFKTKLYQNRSIVVADTVGFCDTEFSDTDTMNMIKGRVNANFKYIDAVFIVFRADRLIKQFVDNIQNVKKWLEYEKNNHHLKFLFVGTHAEHLTDDVKDELRSEAVDMLGLRDTSRVLIASKTNLQSLVYTGFPPEDSLNEKTKLGVQKSWDLLNPLLLNPGKADKLDGSPVRYLGLGDRIDLRGSCNIL